MQKGDFEIMNILILTGRFGMGHIKAAAAVKEQILAQKPEAVVHTVDLMDYLFPYCSSAIYKGFGLLVSRYSNLYNLINQAAGKSGSAPLKSVLRGKVRKLLAKTEADLVISVLPVCAQYISAYKQTTGCRIPLYTYITDITFHNEWYAPLCDFYFVGDQQTKDALLFKGVPSSKVCISGIPVAKSFHRSLSEKDQGKTSTLVDPVYKKNPDSKVRLLIMGGGLGLLPLHPRILQKINDDPQMDAILVAGKNSHLEEQASMQYPNIHVLGYTDNVDMLMARSDIFITKPGGISTFEAIASKTPLFVINPFLEQEIGNAQFIQRNKIGKVLWGGAASANLSEEEAEKIFRELKAVAKNRKMLQTMKENLQILENTFETKCPTDILAVSDSSGFRMDRTKGTGAADIKENENEIEIEIEHEQKKRKGGVFRAEAF